MYKLAWWLVMMLSAGRCYGLRGYSLTVSIWIEIVEIVVANYKRQLMIGWRMLAINVMLRFSPP